jgi:hypothetical protein
MVNTNFTLESVCENVIWLAMLALSFIDFSNFSDNFMVTIVPRWLWHKLN